MPQLSFQAASTYGIAEIAAAVTRSFERYFIPISMDTAHLLSMIRLDGLDLAESRAVLADGAVAGVALVARRGWTSRLAAMGMVPEWRGQGLGKFMMNGLLQDARRRGDRGMVLEVIVENEPAVRLYESFGFRKVRRLVGLSAHSPDAIGGPSLEEIDIRRLAHLVALHGLPDLPWQLSAETIAQFGPPYRAYRVGRAYALISNPDDADVSFRSLLVEPAARQAGMARQLIQAILACYPGKTWHVPAIFPEEIVAPFEGAGFIREVLAQWQMSTLLD